MAKGYVNQGDPNVPVGGEFSPVEDGKHTVNGIADFISTDDKDLPIFKPGNNGKMQVQLKLRKTDGSEGPAFSCTAPEMLALVLVFGGTLPSIKAENRMTAKTLLACQEAANAGGRAVTVESSKGWVNRIPQMQPPRNIFKWRFMGAHRFDYEPESLEWSVSTYGSKEIKNLVFEFEIAADMVGGKTIWEGYPISVFMHDVFEDTLDGKPAECIVFTKTSGGGVPFDAIRWQSFARHFAPGVLEDHDWQRDPLKSDYNVDEVKSPQYVIVREAIKARKEVIIPLSEGKRKDGSIFITLDLKDIPETEEAPVDLDEQQEEETKQPIELLNLVDYIEKVYPGTFEQSTNGSIEIILSEAGRKWAAEVLNDKGDIPGAWQRAGCDPTNKRFASLNAEQATNLLRELKAIRGEKAETDSDFA